MKARSVAALALLATACSSRPWRTDERPKPAEVAAPASRWERFRASSLGPVIDGRRYVVLRGRLAWWEASGEFVHGAATLPSDLGELWAVPTANGVELVARSARATEHHSLGPGPWTLYRLSRDRASAKPILVTDEPFEVIGQSFGALVVKPSLRVDVWQVDVGTGTSKAWAGLARPTWVAWRDQDHGAALLDGAGLVVTRDGGATFQRVAIPDGFRDDDFKTVDWRGDGLVVHAAASTDPRHPRVHAFTLREDSAKLEPLDEVARPLERWLRGSGVPWDLPTWQTIERAMYGVRARDGGALIAGKQFGQYPPGGTVFAHVDLSTGFVDAAFDMRGHACWLMPRDEETMWLGCSADGTRSFWVEEVERDAESLRRALATFPDTTRAFKLHASHVEGLWGAGRSLASGFTVFDGSCENAEWTRDACLVSGATRREIAGEIYHDHERLLAHSWTDFVRVGIEADRLFVRELDANGRFTAVLDDIVIGKGKYVTLRGAYQPQWRRIVALVEVGGDSTYQVDVDLETRQSTTKVLDASSPVAFGAMGQRAVEISGRYARRTLDGGANWSKLALPDGDRSNVVATELGVFAGDRFIVGWDDLETLSSPPPDPAMTASAPPWGDRPNDLDPAILTCELAGPPTPKPGATTYLGQVALDVDGSAGTWSLDWVDGNGKRRTWKGSKVGSGEHDELVKFEPLRSNAVFVVRIDEGSHYVVGRATDDKVEFTRPLEGDGRGVSVAIATADAPLAWVDGSLFVWPAGAEAAAMTDLAPIAGYVEVAATTPDYLLLATEGSHQLGYDTFKRYVSVPATVTARPITIPPVGWIPETAFAVGALPVCPASVTGRVTVWRDARYMARWKLEPKSGPPPSSALEPGPAAYEVGFDVTKPFDPAATCIRRVRFDIGDGSLTYQYDTRRAVIDTLESRQDAKCEPMTEAEYATKVAR